MGGRPAELGLAAVAHPGAILGSPRVVVWWRFTRDRAPTVARLRLSRDERTALATAGVSVPEAGAAMAQEARRWRRPLALASDAVVLIAPRTDEMGEPAHVHPLWDELVAAMPERGEAARLVAPKMTLPAYAARF